MHKKSIKQISILAIYLIIFAFVLNLIIKIGVKESNSTNTNTNLLFTFIFVFYVFALSSQKKKRFYCYYVLMEEGEKMNISIFNEYRGKKVSVNNIDEYFEGVLESLEDDFIKVCKYNKDGSLKLTKFISTKTITSITIKEQ